MSNNNREKLEKAADKMFAVRKEKEANEELQDSPYVTTPSLNLRQAKPPKPIVTSISIPKELMGEIDKKSKKEGVPKVRIILTILDMYFRGKLVEKKDD